MVYRHEPTGITLYFESDGQHVAAIDPNGRLLWHRNPTEQATNTEGPTGKDVRQLIHYAGPLDQHDLEGIRNVGRKGEYIAICIHRERGLLEIHSGEYHSTRSD